MRGKKRSILSTIRRYIFCSIRKYNYILLHLGHVISCMCVTGVSLYFVLQICFPTIWQINVYSSEVIVHSWSVYMFVCCKPESAKQQLISSFAIFIFFKAIWSLILHLWWTYNLEHKETIDNLFYCLCELDIYTCIVRGNARALYYR